MAQKPQIIDITRSYVPGDPNAFPENLISTQSQDGEEKTPPVSIYEGYNFLPTPYGYKSYFGTTATLDVPVVPARAQFILSYQSAEYINNLIALCEDGIWIIDPTADTNTWKHVVTHTFDADVFEEWTWCIIENSLYCYKQGGASYYHTADTDDVPNDLSISIVTVVPSFLNMAGQMGIFKAGTRLGFWDSANSVAWSSNLDLADLTPSLETLAGNTIFGAVIGRITHVRDHGEGFVIYSTKSIVGASFDASSNMLWDAHTISGGCGVAVGREVTQGSSNSEHFAYTTSGMYRIGAFNGLTKQHEFQQVAIELSDLLKESRDPVYLDCVEGRYLYLHCINDDYINGITSFESVSIDGMDIDGIPLLDSQKIAPQLLVKMLQKIEQDTADATYGATLTDYVADATPFDVIEWEMNFRMPSTLGLYEKLQRPALGEAFDYLLDPDNLDRSDEAVWPYSWDDRTPTGTTFMPSEATGAYIALDASPYAPSILPTEAILYNRETVMDMTFERQANLVEKFQADAFLGEDIMGQIPSGSIVQASCNLQPSYLTLTARTKNGLLEELYNITSLWKDYEKRQQLVLTAMQELVEGLYDNEWTVYTTVTFAADDPAAWIAKIYKPLGTVGIQPMDKGFFFYKQYRDFYDLTLVATRTAERTDHVQISDGDYAVSAEYSLWDSVDITATVPGALLDPQFSVVGASIAPYEYATYENSSICLFSSKMYLAIYGISDLTGMKTYILSSTNGVTWAQESLIDHGTQPDFDGMSYDSDYATTFVNLIAMNGYLYCVASRQVAGYTCGFRSSDGISWTRIEAAASGPIPEDMGTFALCYGNDSKAYVYVRSGAVPGRDKLYSTTDFITFTYHGVGIGTVFEHLIRTSSHFLLQPSAGTQFARSTDGVAFTLGTVCPGGTIAGRPYIVKGAKAYVFFVGTSLNTVYSYDGITWVEEGTINPAQREHPLCGVNFNSKNYLIAQDNTLALEPNWVTKCLEADDVYGEFGPGEPETITLDLTAHDPNYLMGIIEDSKVSGIHFPVADVYIEIKDWYFQLFNTPWTATGYFSMLGYDTAGPSTDELEIKFTPRTYIDSPSIFSTDPDPVAVVWEVRKEAEALAELYPYLINAVDPTPTVVAYYQSFEQAYLTLAMNGRYLSDTLQSYEGPTGRLFVQSSDVDDYYSSFTEDFVEIRCRKILYAGSEVDGCVVIMRQSAGFLYQYDVEENFEGSLIDNSSVDLSGGLLTPALADDGAFNTVGALFTPKNKISCTIEDGALVQGTVTPINTYATLQTFAEAYLGNEGFTSDVYNLPPVYDGGEYWWYMKDADHFYQSQNPMNHREGSISGVTYAHWSTVFYLENINPYDIPLSDVVIIIPSLGTLPGTTYNLQVGVPAASYPTFLGAYVFDLGLKKWGKLKATYKNLVTFSPLNTNVGGTIAYTNFGMDSGLVLASNYISPFDTAPADSWIRVGKIGYYRLGMTNLLEVKAMFRASATGTLTTDTSMDGRTLDPSLRQLTSFTGISNLTAYPDVAGRWHTIKIEGNYDLQYLEIRGTIAGRR